ncbi:MAG: DUF423 domain-containing protein [Chloroflexota bacterium]
MEKMFFMLASIFAGLAVALGAFGAHALTGRIEPSLIETFETGARYHFYHALALVAVAVVIGRWPEASLAPLAGWLFVVGILLFSGSLYALALSGIRILGAITPLGGLAFIGGWICLALAVWRS